MGARWALGERGEETSRGGPVVVVVVVAVEMGSRMSFRFDLDGDAICVVCVLGNGYGFYEWGCAGESWEKCEETPTYVGFWM